MKSILVHIDASPRSAERLVQARSLALSHGAELSVFYGVLPALVASPWVAQATDASVVTLLAELERAQRQRARAMFEPLAGPQVRWLEAAEPQLTQRFTHEAFTHDLLVMGQFDADDAACGPLPPDFVTGAVVASGRPTLVVPYVGSFHTAPERVLLAWKPTRESARAAHAALPWLQRARTVLLACSPEQPDVAPQAGGPFAPVEHWLRLQGVAANVEHCRLGGSDAGEALLSLAAESSAGLMVMGCYGHSRSREWLLGGVTRTVMRSMTLPVLMSH